MPEIQSLPNGKGRFISHLSEEPRMTQTATPTNLEASAQERANQFRAEAEIALRSILEIMDRAKSAGFTLGWNIATDPQGRHFLNGSVSVARYF